TPAGSDQERELCAPLTDVLFAPQRAAGVSFTTEEGEIAARLGSFRAVSFARSVPHRRAQPHKFSPRRAVMAGSPRRTAPAKASRGSAVLFRVAAPAVIQDGFIADPPALPGRAVPGPRASAEPRRRSSRRGPAPCERYLASRRCWPQGRKSGGTGRYPPPRPRAAAAP